MKNYLVALALAFGLASCGGSEQAQQTTKKTTQTRVEAPAFNQDSAYVYIEKQVAFGPRVPNTSAHDSCAAYLSAKLKSFGAQVVEQKATLTAFDGTKLKATNIIGTYQPNKKYRVVLMAHWDSRPFADHDPDESKQKEPILGANDGGSGVGVLLEVARQFQQKAPNIGVDIVFFDAEDYGAPDWHNNQSSDTWCLGSQYWAKTPHVKDYHASYGILLDMVGAPNATFTREALSMHYAEHIVQKVWDTASKLGYSDYFSYDKTHQIIDDHTYVNQIANIPSIDIIQYEPTTEAKFGTYWHTHNDNMDVIDKSTLKAVGQTLLQVLYSE